MKKLLNVYSSLKKDRSLFSLSFLIEFAWNLLLIELLDRLMAYSAQSDLCLFSKTSVLFCIGAVIFVLLVFSDQYFFRKLKGDVNGCCEHHSSNISAAGISFDPTSS